MNSIKNSELILNPDGSVYHLHLLPEDIADTIITVGDPNRVQMVSANFDTIEVKKEKREFFTHTGTYKGKRLTVISSGIGTDNIDIVLNEIDALVNVDLNTRQIKQEHKSLKFVRIGTSGCMDSSIPIDATLLSSYGLGIDGLLNYYDYSLNPTEQTAVNTISQMKLFEDIGIRPYLFEASPNLVNRFTGVNVYQGITATCTGFYAPQGRTIRLKPKANNFFEQLKQINIDGTNVTNFEMETAALYGLSKMLGHEALAVNLLIANRERGEFSKNPKESMQKLIKWSLNKLVD